MSKHKPDRGNPPLPFLESGLTKKKLKAIDQAYDAIVSVRENPTSIKAAYKLIKTAKAYADGEVTLRNMRETMITGPEFDRLKSDCVSLVIKYKISKREISFTNIMKILEAKRSSKTM